MSRHYFNNFSSKADQKLIEDLIVESIQIYGIDAFYLPRVDRVFDSVYTEGPAPEFTRALQTTFYIKTFDSFQGQGDLLSKFGLEIRDQMTFTVARRTFTEDVCVPAAIVRPREGDLIYFPLNLKLFEVKFVEHEAVFYQMGALQMWDMRCELIEYTNQIISTGIEEIDDRYGQVVFDRIGWALLTEDGYPLAAEDGSILLMEDVDQDISDREYKEPDQREVFEEEKTGIIDSSETDPFSGL